MSTINELRKLDMVAYAQSCYEGHEAAQAISHERGTSWKAGPYYQWLILDFQSVCYLSSLNIIFSHIGEYYHYHVELSIDHLNWDFIYEKGDNSFSTASGDIIDINKEGQYIRITITYCSNSRDVEIQDITVFGKKVSYEAQTNDIREHRVLAGHASEIVGFTSFVAGEFEPGWNPQAIFTNEPGSYISYKSIDFKGYYNQLRFMLGTPYKSKTHYLTIKFYLDSINDDNEINSIHLCRQWKNWSEIAVDLLNSDGTNITGIHDLYIRLDSIDAPQQMQLLYCELNKRPYLSDKILDYNEDLIVDDGEDYKVYFGNMHSHTAFSDGSATPEFAYYYGRHIAKLDFLGITEHSNCLDEPFDSNKSRKFRDLKEKAEEMTENGKFIALYGSETTFYNQFGHMNIYCADFYLNSYEFRFDNCLEYYDTLKKYPYIISQWNHPWSCGDRHFDMFMPYDPELDTISYTVELNDIEKPDEVLKWYVMALDAGWHLAPVGNQDNHLENWGSENGIRTGVIAKKLTAGHIYDAMKHLRVYFTGAPDITIIYKVNDFMQGSIIATSDQLTASVTASTSEGNEFKKIEVWSDGGHAVKEIELNSSSIRLVFALPKGYRYYFIKIIRKDDKFAVTAPIWVE